MLHRHTFITAEAKVERTEVVVADGSVQVKFVSTASERRVVGHFVAGHLVVAVVAVMMVMVATGGSGGGVGGVGGVGESGEVV